MNKYHFNDIEAKWQKYWADNQTFKAKNPSSSPSEGLGEAFYALDMFPYPSGAGLHVGHPLGYIASDIYARYKRHKGFNVLHPMGYDSFGLPAEQYAIQTGQHPAKTTEENIARYREQLDRIGFSFDWSREVRTSDPEYYKWTQWIFIQLFESWYDTDADKARPIEDLISIFSIEGNSKVKAVCDEDMAAFSSTEWNSFTEEKKQEILLKYRLTYLAETEVNWCPQLGTVLANDEIINGVSERGGHPVIRKKMLQWSMRITAYAQRMLDGLEKIDWPQPLKDSQTNWIGKSIGAEAQFKIQNSKFNINVFTTRPDTIFGVSFMVLAPEHELVSQITTADQKAEVDAYIEKTSKRSERERMADVKTISGVFTGAYAEHPFTKEPLPIWVADYVLAGYGTGAVMAVPSGDQRDHDFAKHFNLPIPNVFKDVDISESAYSDKDGAVLANSGFLNGLSYKEGVKKAIEELERINQGKGKTNFRLRDAVFSRQRYWGEPFPVYYKNGLPYTISTECLPLRLPEVEKYLPTEEGEPPLGRATKWYWNEKTNKVVSPPLEGLGEDIYPLELNTMPGWAGSSWYFFRYMEDVKRDEVFASKEALNYWQNVDLYIGGSEHATGHLLYARFWTKFLKDRGFVEVEEPFKKLINQGMILGESAFVYRLKLNYKSQKTINQIEDSSSVYNIYVSKSLKEQIENGESIDMVSQYLNRFILSIDKNEIEGGFKLRNNEMIEILNEEEYLITKDGITSKIKRINSFEPKHVDIALVNNSNHLNINEFKKHWNETDAIFILENGEVYDPSPSGRLGGDFKVSREPEKMSKSKYNVVNPDDICKEYGADTLRMYEMFLGPLEQAKPWSTAGITGVHGFLKKLWRLYHFGINPPFEGGEGDVFHVSEDKASPDSLKILHKTIKKVEEDIENFSFNTSVSTFMIAVNELTALKCNHREILEPLAILISPYAPHIAEELWSKLGHHESISTTPFPKFEAGYLVENTKEYPVSFNGKTRFTLELPLTLTKEEIETAVMSHEKTLHYLEGRAPKKVIIVPGKIVNIVG